jgi:DNA-binding NarL/FixJ family response regulator
MIPRERLTSKEIQISILVWQGLTNREIGKIIGTSEQVIKNHLRSAFDKLGVWSRLELAMYIASHGGKDWPSEIASADSAYSSSEADSCRGPA